MGTINVGRLVLGGVVAGIVIWIIEGMASVMYMDEVQAAMESHGLSMDMTAGVFLMTVVVSLLAGLVLVFFYAAARPRFGPGPKTAVIVAVALWVAAVFLSLMGYQMLGLFPDRMLMTWGVVGFVEWNLAALAGAWIYREE